MAEDVKTDVADNQSGNEPETDVDLTAIKAEIKAELESEYKSQISGLDKKVTELQNEKKQIETEKLTEAEKTAQRIEALEKLAKENEFKARQSELRNYAINLLSENGINPGKVDLIIDNSEDNIVKKLNELIDFQKSVKDSIYKDNAQKPEIVQSQAGISFNPYKKETYNLTKQAEIEDSDPKLALELQKQAKT